MTRSDSRRLKGGPNTAGMDSISAETNFNFKPNETEDFECGPMTSTNCTMQSQVSVPRLPALVAYNNTDVNPLFSDFANLSVQEESFEKNDDTLNESEIKSSFTTQQAARNSLLYLADDDGDTPLHISILREDYKISTYIVNCAPDFVHLNIYNNLGQTPAHLAALTNSSIILRKVMCAGADISCQDKNGNTPLHIACKHGYLEVVKQLLRPIDYVETLENRYAIPFTAIPQNMKTKNVDGLTCLHLSVLQNNVDIVRLLMESGANANLGDSKSGRTALHLAAEQGMLDIVSLFLSYPRTNVNVQTYAGYTPTQLAYSRGHTEVTKLLLEKSSLHSSECYSSLLEVEDCSEDSDIDMDS